MRKSRLALLIALMAAIATLIFAQSGRNGQGPRYDPAAEVTLTGTVGEIKTLETMCHSGTHVTLNTDRGSIEVALGPADFLKDQKLALGKGDQVQVVGAKTNTRHGEMFVARRITSGGKDLTLRDAQGVPIWPRGMCQ